MRRAHAVATGCALMGVLAVAGAASGSCTGSSPEVVLDCFSRAYSERDAELLEQVLAPDYIWIAVARPLADVFTREDSVTSSVKMFEDPMIESVVLEFHDGYQVVVGENPDTWRIEDLVASLRVKQVGQDTPSQAILCATLYVRRVNGERPGYEVYREVFFEEDGCVGK